MKIDACLGLLQINKPLCYGPTSETYWSNAAFRMPGIAPEFSDNFAWSDG